jgi:hypothetical protein
MQIRKTIYVTNIQVLHLYDQSGLVNHELKFTSQDYV